MSTLTYSQSLDALVQLTTVVADRVASIKGEAAQRGHMASIDRSSDLAEKLAVELAELQVTDASDRVSGRRAA